MSAMKLIIESQFEENYGAHTWEGQGDCPQYWKMKGGSEYQFNLTLADAMSLGGKGLQALVSELAAKHINKNSEYSREYVFDWQLLEDAQPTDTQALYEGCGYCPQTILITR